MFTNADRIRINHKVWDHEMDKLARCKPELEEAILNKIAWLNSIKKELESYGQHSRFNP